MIHEQDLRELLATWDAYAKEKADEAEMLGLRAGMFPEGLGEATTRCADALRALLAARGGWEVSQPSGMDLIRAAVVLDGEASARADSCTIKEHVQILSACQDVAEWLRQQVRDAGPGR